MKKFYFLFLFFSGLCATAQVYKHDFGSTAITTHPYISPPLVFQNNLSASSWSNSNGSWTSYAGNTGEAIALANSSGTPTITLTFNIAAGYKLNITSFNFWRQRSATGAQNWSMNINGIAAGSGTVPTTGAMTGITTVANPVNGLAGTVTIVISLSGASGSGTFRIDDFTLNGLVIPNQFVLLDNFNRNDTIRPAIPSSGGPEWWREVEPGIFCSVLQTVRIKSNQLELSGCDLSNTACSFSPTQTASMDMSLRYPNVFATAAGTMEWYFNMQQNRPDPTGFSGGQYGVAFVIGSNTNDPSPSLTKYGYAVIFGESGATDPVRLVSFNGTSFNSTTFTNIISVPSPAVKTNHMSVRVTYNPCNNEWTLTVRDDGLSFADPATITGSGTSAVNSTFTSSDLRWMGMVWNHASSCNLAKFDNVYIPNTGAVSGTYIWKGSTGTDFQSPYNWSPVRQCVKVTDKLVFNSSSPASSVVTNIPGQSIAQLTVTNNRSVTIADIEGDGTASTLTISGSTGTDLVVDAGSSVLYDVSSASAGDAMLLSLGAGATASISGTIEFRSTPGGTKTHRLQAADALSININSGGVIKAVALSGNPFGNTLPQNTVVFNAGSVYECYSGANPFGLSQPDSKVIFSNGSIYRHYTASQPSILGRTYADFESYAGYTINTGGASAFTVNNFKVIAGTVLFTGDLNSQPVNTNIKADLLISPGAVFGYDPIAASIMNFNSASSAQKIDNSGTLTLGKQLTVRVNSTYPTPPQLTVEKDITIHGMLDIVSGTLKLSGNITLKSDADATASVAPITGSINYGAGRFIVERYIPVHQKAWQFLAVPTNGQTVQQAWQEGNMPMVAGTPGLGTLITSNTPGTGFDFIGGTGPSMKTYDTSGDGGWKGITRTDTALYNQKGYMIFVRGDRTVSTAAAPATATTLRSKGQLFDPVYPPPVTSIGNGKFESAGNPYASAIDFSNDLAVIKSANVQKVFYVWDPKLGSSYGGYQTFIKGAGSDYTVLPGGGSYPPAGSVYNLIQSGQAFFVKTFGGSGTISFTENAKVAGSNLVTRQGGAVRLPTQKLISKLFLISGGNAVLLDAAMNEYSSGYSNAVDIQDALKMGNTSESIGLKCGTEILAVDRRRSLNRFDTIYLNLDRLQFREYEFEFTPENFSRPGFKALLEDTYLAIKTAISLNAISKVRFSVNSDPGSYAAGRFRIVFQKSSAFIPGLKPGPEPGIQLHPNPVSDQKLYITFSNMPPGKYRVQLFDRSSVIIMEREMDVSGNVATRDLTLPVILPGSYRLVVTDASGNRTAKQVLVAWP